MNRARLGHGIVLLLVCAAAQAQTVEDDSDGHMREELGVNEFTTPSIRWLLLEMDNFTPLPNELVDKAKYDTVFPNRIQTATHFGSTIADGFIAVSNRRDADVRDISRALLRQARALGVVEPVARHSKRILELSQSGNWNDLRMELAGAQQDAEQGMIRLRDEQLAHFIALGGWLKGFHAALVSTNANYNPERAEELKKVNILDYFIDRLDTLHPQIKKTELIITISSRLKTMRYLIADSYDRPLAQADVRELLRLSDEIQQAVSTKSNRESEVLNLRP